MKTENAQRARISAATWFDSGDPFDSPAAVRVYFTLAAMIDMHGPDWAEGGREWDEPAPLWTQGEPWTQTDLDEWAGLVIDGRWHCRFQPLSVIEAAAALDVDASTVRHAIRDGRLSATKRGRDWWLDAADVERYGRERKPRPAAP